MRSVVDRNVVMRRIPVVERGGGSVEIHHPRRPWGLFQWSQYSLIPWTGNFEVCSCNSLFFVCVWQADVKLQSGFVLRVHPINRSYPAFFHVADLDTFQLSLCVTELRLSHILNMLS